MSAVEELVCSSVGAMEEGRESTEGWGKGSGVATGSAAESFMASGGQGGGVRTCRAV